MFAGDHHMQPTQHGSNIAISETSSDAGGSHVAASRYPTPVESRTVSMTQLEQEQVVMRELVTQQPHDADTPHQMVIIMIDSLRNIITS